MSYELTETLAHHPQAPRCQTHRHSRRQTPRNPASHKVDRESFRSRELQHPAEQRTAGTPGGRSCSFPYDSEAERGRRTGCWVADDEAGSGESEVVAGGAEVEDVRGRFGNEMQYIAIHCGEYEAS